MKRMSKKIVRSQRGASLAEYSMIVALLSLVMVIAVPGVSTQVKRISCAVISLNQANFNRTTGRCIAIGHDPDLAGQTHMIMDPYW